MIILDTDHVSALQHPEAARARTLANRLAASPDREIVITAVSTEEQLRGWLALLNRYRELRQQAEYYERLISMIRFYNDWNVLGFDEVAQAQFVALRASGVRIGPSDLKIASVAITQKALLLSSNAKDFSRVPGLSFEDWTVSGEQP